MKIVALSDMHGEYNIEIPEADIMCICGDIVPCNVQSSTERSLVWFKEEFIPWCLNQPVNHTFFIGGNHDWFLERCSIEEIKEIVSELGNDKITYLIDEEAIYYHEPDSKSYKIYGSPWCHQFYNWAFMIPDEEMTQKFALIPEDVDILLTHDAPFGRTDLLLQNPFYTAKGHLGNEPMRVRLEEISPKLHFTGHLHSCNHVPTEYNGTTTVCVSILNENYYPVYEPFVISI